MKQRALKNTSAIFASPESPGDFVEPIHTTPFASVSLLSRTLEIVLLRQYSDEPFKQSLDGSGPSEFVCILIIFKLESMEKE